MYVPDVILEMRLERGGCVCGEERPTTEEAEFAGYPPGAKVVSPRCLGRSIGNIMIDQPVPVRAGRSASLGNNPRKHVFKKFRVRMNGIDMIDVVVCEIREFRRCGVYVADYASEEGSKLGAIHNV